jgi:anthranilate synthase component 1
MYSPSFDEFRQLAAKGNTIPVFREQLADMETPVSAMSRFAEDESVFLLESVEGGERWARYSFIGLHPSGIFTIENGVPYLHRDGQSQRLPHSGDPLNALRTLLAKTKFVALPSLPRFVSGAAGYMGYEIINTFEKMPAPKTQPETPETCMMLTDDIIVFDNVRHTLKMIACARTENFASLEEAYADACQRIDAIADRLRQPAPAQMRVAEGTEAHLESNLSREAFGDMVRQAKEYICSGDIIQVVLSQRFRGTLPAPPLTLYRALRLINPSPYTFFLKFGGRVLVGSSPEIMVRLTDGTAELRPIAGTRPRGKSEQEDRQLANELLADEKEKAEHLMLVDLGRNDLGRVAVAGSVQVRDFMTVERYSHVMHLVSHIQATLLPEQDAYDLIRATFPAGTLSGAPKIRAMEIINELEPISRGVYGGAVGYISADGNMDLAITIRTLEIADNQVTLQAGAGIVYDSDPDKEYDETCHKARGMVAALELAADNLELAQPKG